MSMKLSLEINPEEHGLMPVDRVQEAYRLLAEVYGALWTEAYYDPFNEKTREFARPLAEKFEKVNGILGFKR